MKRISRKIRRIAGVRKINRQLRKVLTVFACIVVFITTYTLILPAITLEKGALICGKEVHEHSDSCYADVLVCTLQESEGHTHNEFCYHTDSILTCEQPEHMHTEECLDEEGNYICGLEEHSHDETDCYDAISTLICDLEESEGHTHTASCYEHRMVCGMEYHIHTASCYAEKEPVSEENAPAEAENSIAEDESIEELIEESDEDTIDENATDQDAAVEDSIDENAADQDTAEEDTIDENAADQDTAEEDTIDENAADQDTAEEDTTNEATTEEPADDESVEKESAEETPSESAPAVEETSEEAAYEESANDDTANDDSTENKKADKDENLEILPSVDLSGSLTEDSGLWILSEENTWERIDENISITPSDNILVRLDYQIPAARLDKENADTVIYPLPEALCFSQEKAEYINNDSNYLNQVIAGARMPEELNGSNDGMEYLAGKYFIESIPTDKAHNKKTSGAAENGQDWQLVCSFNEYSIYENSFADLNGWIMFYLTGADLAVDENGQGRIVFTEAGTDGRRVETSYHVKSDEATEESSETEEASETEESSEDEETEESSEAEETEEDNHLEEMVEQYPAQTFEASTGTMNVTVYAGTGAFPTGTTMVVTDVDDEDTVAAIVDAVNDNSEKNTTTHHVIAADITFYDKDGQKIEPLIPIHVAMNPIEVPENLSAEADSVIVHVDDSGSAEIVEQRDVNEVIGEIREEEITRETVSDEAGNKNEVTDEEGNNEIVEESSIEDILPLPEEAIVFDAEKFSVYAVVYTVDFHYEVNGKTYEFSIPGGGFVSFTDLVEVLGIIGDTNSDINKDENGSVIAENTEENTVSEDTETNPPLTLGEVEVSETTKKFVAEVVSVEFSSPSLLDLYRVDENTTVGQIKEKRGLECEYSAELTEEQIAEINAQTVETGDWALISVQPFTTKETLTITMMNGDVWTVQVTDDQLHSYVIFDSGETYKVTVTYNETAQIPEGAELKVKQYMEGEPEYRKAKELLKQEEAFPEEETSETIPTENSGLMVFDISIYDENGNLVEPQGEVSVKIELVSLPEEADKEILKETMSVYHIVKDGDGETAVPVADTGILSEGTVAVDTEENKAVAEFVTDSFSIYTVKWGYGTNQEVRLHFVNESGQELTGVTYNGSSVDGSTITIGNNNTGILNFDSNGILDLTDFHIDGYTLSNTHKSTWQDLEGSYNSVDLYEFIGYTNRNTGNYPHTIIGNEIRLHNGVIQYKLYYANSDKAGWYWFDAGKEPVRNNGFWKYDSGHDPTDHTQVDDNDAHPYDYYLVYSQNPSGNGSGGSNSDLGDIPEIGHTKEKTSNYDGTYNLELGVSSEAIEKEVDNHINVILVVDTSSSMRRDYANDIDDYGNNAGSEPRSRIYQTRQAVTGFVTDLMKNNQTDPDAVEMELITFNMGASVYQGWTKNASTFNEKINNMPLSSGTNWAEALKLARTEALAKDDGDPTYVLFLTDGAPSQYWDKSALSGYYVSGEGCYLGARDEARAAVRDGVKLYTIFSYGTPTDKNNDYLGKLTDYAYNSDSAKSSYRYYAGSGSELKTKLQSILNTVEEKHFGAGEVQINDGITELTTVTFEHINPESFEYTITYKDYTDENDPTVFTEYTLTNGNGLTVTGTGNEQTIQIPSYTYGTWQNDVYKTVNTDAVTIKGAVFTDSPEKKVTWKLEKTDGTTYILEDNWNYKVKFKIWPSQDSYDLIAALNNGFLTWGQDFVNGDHTIPASEYRAQIDNTVSPYALKTNTTANVTYKETTSTTVNGETTYNYGDLITVDLPTVDGMPLDNTMISLEKVWNSTLSTDDKPNSVDLYILIDPTDEKINAFNAAYEAMVNNPSTENVTAFKATYYYKAELNENSNWKEDVSIAPGVYDQYGDMNTTGHTYMVMEPAIDGHYELEATPTHPMLNGLTHDANDPNTIKDMVDVYGYNTSSLNVNDPDTYPPTYVQEDQKSKYSVANTLKAGININKEIVDVSASQRDYLNMDEYFTIKVSLVDGDNHPVFDSTDGSGAVGYRIYAPAEIPEGATVIPEGAEGNDVTGYQINEITYTAQKEGDIITGFAARGLLEADGTATLKIRECDNLRIVNVPMGTTYTVEEMVDSASDFGFKELYWEVKKEGNIFDGKTALVQTRSTTQTIVPDAENNVTVRNKPKELTKDLTFKKIGENDAGLPGAIFQLMVKNGAGVYQPVAEVEGYDTIKINGSELGTSTIAGVEKKSTFTTTGDIQTLSPLSIGGYKLVELQAPDGYIITLNEFEFMVTGQGISMITDGNLIRFEATPATGEAQLTIANTPGAVLPNTGGSGIQIFRILGSILILVAGVLLWRRQRLI